MKIESNIFGTTPAGEEVKRYVLTNDLGYYVSILTYGGILQEVVVPNREGKAENVVIGHDNMEGYIKHNPNLGTITGRFAGRISNASFTLNGETYQLAKNDGNNCLHGGLKAFDKVVWSATEIKEADYVGLSLNYFSPDMEEGFPGNLDITVTYKWNNNNELSISYKATTDKETLITVTNHAYFNLTADYSKSILDHVLQINSDYYVEIREDAIPCAYSPVDNTPFDFRTPKAVGRDINSDNQQLKNGKGYDHPIKLNPSPLPQISLYEPTSGRKVEVSTDEEYVVLYSGNHLAGVNVNGTILKPRSGICLETQYCPDNINFDAVPTKTLKPGELYNHTTVFKFTIA